MRLLVILLLVMYGRGFSQLMIIEMKDKTQFVWQLDTIGAVTFVNSDIKVANDIIFLEDIRKIVFPTITTNVSMPPAGEKMDLTLEPERNGQVIRFVLKEHGLLDLTIFNLLGKEIKRMWSGPVKAGVHQLMWNGNDEQNKMALPGIYTLRLTFNNIITKKIFLQTNQ